MNKKAIALLLGMTMIASSLVGCGDSKTTQSSETKEVQNQSVAESEEGKEEKEELEFVTLKMVAVGDSNEPSREVFLEKINEMLLRDLNCEIVVEDLNWSEWRDKYNLTFASGESWDMIFAADWAMYAQSALKGCFYELTEEDIQTYMPRTWEAGKDFLDGVKINGKIYMTPQTKPSYDDYTFVAVRGDIMKEAGIEDITSVQELEGYLDYVVENYPEMKPLNITSDGRASWATSLAGSYYAKETGFHGWNPDYALGLAGPGALGAPYIVDLSDPANLTFLDDETVDEYYIKLYKKTQEWQKKGYWSADCLSANTGLESYYLEGIGAAAPRQIGSVAGWVKTMRDTHPEADARIVRVAESPLYQTPSCASGTAFNPKSKNIERAMMACDLMSYDQEYNDLLMYGIEGVHYNLTNEGKVEGIANPEYTWSLAAGAGFNKSVTRDSASRIPEYFEFEEEFGSQTLLMSSFVFDTTSVQNEYAAIDEVYARYTPILNAGIASDVEATYYEFKQAMKDAGLDVLLEEWLKQLQAYFDSLN